MDPVAAARATADAVVELPAGFMMDGATYQQGEALGFEGIDFYTGGRGGALGDVDGAVVAAAFVFFNPEGLSEQWTRAGKVMGRREAAAAFLRCLEEWAATHMTDAVDHRRLAELIGRVVAGASPAGAPLLAAWRTMPEPAEPTALALHRVNMVRELRGAAHGCAVLAAGMSPLEAVMVKSPFMAGLFGWPEPYPDTASCIEAWERAEDATNRAVGRAYGVLGASELDELTDLMTAAHEGAT